MLRFIVLICVITWNVCFFCNIQKTHHSGTVHRCSSSFQPLSDTHGFSSCLFKTLDKAWSALIGQLSHSFVTVQPLPVCAGYVGLHSVQTDVNTRQQLQCLKRHLESIVCADFLILWGLYTHWCWLDNTSDTPTIWRKHVVQPGNCGKAVQKVLILNVVLALFGGIPD